MQPEDGYGSRLEKREAYSLAIKPVDAKGLKRLAGRGCIILSVLDNEALEKDIETFLSTQLRSVKIAVRQEVAGCQGASGFSRYSGSRYP